MGAITLSRVPPPLHCMCDRPPPPTRWLRFDKRRRRIFWPSIRSLSFLPLCYTTRRKKKGKKELSIAKGRRSQSDVVVVVLFISFPLTFPMLPLPPSSSSFVRFFGHFQKLNGNISSLGILGLRGGEEEEGEWAVSPPRGREEEEERRSADD